MTLKKSIKKIQPLLILFTLPLVGNGLATTRYNLVQYDSTVSGESGGNLPNIVRKDPSPITGVNTRHIHKNQPPANPGYYTNFNNWAGADTTPSSTRTSSVPFTITEAAPGYDPQDVVGGYVRHESFQCDTSAVSARIQSPAEPSGYTAQSYCWTAGGRPYSVLTLHLDATPWFIAAEDNLPEEIRVSKTQPYRHASGSSYFPWGGNITWQNGMAAMNVVYRRAAITPTITVNPALIECGVITTEQNKPCASFDVRTTAGMPFPPGRLKMESPDATSNGEAEFQGGGTLRVIDKQTDKDIALDGKTVITIMGGTQIMNFSPIVGNPAGVIGTRSTTITVTYEMD